MRLLVLTTSFPSSGYPTSGIFIQRMLTRLPQKIRTTVLAPASNLKDAEYGCDGIFKCVLFRYSFFRWQVLAHRPGGIPEALRQGLRMWALLPPFTLAMLNSTISQSRHADLIHAHWSYCGVIAGLAGMITGTPVVTTLRGSDVRLANTKPIYKQLILWCSKLNLRIVTVGRAMSDQVGKWLPNQAGHIVTISNGVDGDANSAQRTFRDKYRVVVIGNLIPLKHVDVIIRACASLALKEDRLNMLIIGAGPEISRLKDLARKVNMDERIVFTGQISPEKTIRRLSESGVLVLASSGEGRPNVVLEAMAIGVPVVASDIAAVRELIGNNERGLLFPVGDDDHLAGCIKRVLENPDLGHRMAERASKWVHDQGVTWERSAQQYAALYHEVLIEFRRRSEKRSCVG